MPQGAQVVRAGHHARTAQRGRHHREGLKVCGLAAGGSRIRTSGPSNHSSSAVLTPDGKRGHSSAKSEPRNSPTRRTAPRSMTPAGSSHCRRDTFSEGQDVKAGDLLAQIDPRPFQAAYDQALAKKVQERVCMHHHWRRMDSNRRSRSQGTPVSFGKGGVTRLRTSRLALDSVPGGIRSHRALMRSSTGTWLRANHCCPLTLR